MNEFLEQFVIESRELVDHATRDLLALEQSPQDRDRLDSAFRAFHTLKGGAGIVDFEAMARALHAAEDAVSAVRSGDRPVTGKLVSDCLASLDQVTAWMSEIERRDDLPANAAADADRIVRLFAAADTASGAQNAPAADLLIEIIDAQRALASIAGEGAEARIASAARTAANALRARGHGPLATQVEDGAGDVEGALETVLQALQAPTATYGREEGVARAVRVDTARIDALVKLTGELTIAKNAIGHIADLARGGAPSAQLADLLRDHHASLDRLVRELQASVLSVRVLPLGQMFQRFPRLVREMSAELDRPARLILEGEDTEADKAVVEALYEPLLHVVRNAVDHGVEAAAARGVSGKPAVARIVMRARRDGDHVVVEVEDDGGGVDVARVRELAVERGVANRDAVVAMTDAQALDLIFMPGFSTAQTVTQRSGRGVGMDAVRAAVEAMEGRVEVASEVGRGTIVRLRLPFTLMMTRVMIVHAGRQAFGLPLDAVVETIRIPRTAISGIGAARVFVHRDATVPLADLPVALDRSLEGPWATIVLTRVGGELLGFEIDRVGSSLDVMLAPPEGLLAGARGIAGATVLGDGQVLIVLDLEQLSG